MTRRSRRAALNPVYPRGQIEENCPHAVEARVVYDKLTSGYRAGLHCGCGRVNVTSSRVHEGHAAAEGEARRMVEKSI